MSPYLKLQELIEIDSPSGFTKTACTYIQDTLHDYGYETSLTNKGAIKCKLGKEPILSIAAHVDTLGTIISGINKDGTLAFSTIGGLSLPSAEGEYVTLYTLEDKVYTGTILFNNPSKHANAQYSSAERKIESMHIRLDELVKSSEDVKKLGINIGDFACLRTHYEESPSGYIKSRFLDNKAGCFVLFEIARRLKATNQEIPVELFFSNYEEVGHGGASGFSSSVEDLLVIDMGVIGDACEGQETSCSICAKDSTGPYDYEFRRKLVKLAQENNIPYKIDVYPYYGSDGSAALRAGNDLRVALIGPGVAASHGNERTHKDAIEATIQLCVKYIETII